jgi:anti-sigma-K factor RskA
MKRYSREELLELAPAYAVGATDADETAAVEAALATTPELAAEVAAYRDVSSALAQQQSMTPSAAVRAEFLKRIGGEKVVALADAGRERRDGVPAVSVPGPATRVPAWMPILLAASVLVSLYLGVQNASLKRAAAARESALAAATTDAETRHHQLNLILEGEKDLHVVHLTMRDTTQGPGAQFFWNAKQHRAMVHAFRLRPAPQGRTYQVWFIVAGKPVSVGTFNSDADGHALAESFTVPESVTAVTDVLITEEPAGGSPLPTTTPFLGGKLEGR